MTLEELADAHGIYSWELAAILGRNDLVPASVLTDEEVDEFTEIIAHFTETLARAKR